MVLANTESCSGVATLRLSSMLETGVPGTRVIKKRAPMSSLAMSRTVGTGIEVFMDT